MHELSPVAGRAGAGGHEGLLLGESEPRVAIEQDGGDDPGRRFRIAALPGDPGRRGEQAEFLWPAPTERLAELRRRLAPGGSTQTLRLSPSVACVLAASPGPAPEADMPGWFAQKMTYTTGFYETGRR
jgi:hypothetical protein